MFDSENDIDCGVVANGHYLIEYGLFSGTTFTDDGQSIPTLYSTIPCPENEPEIRVIVKVPPADHAYNAVLYVDGELASSKCRQEGLASKIVINSVRVSANEARSLKLKRLKYDASSEVGVDPQTGSMRVDVWTGWKGSHSYEPILRYGEHVSYGSNDDMQRNAINFGDDKSFAEVTHKIDYGPVYIKPDRRRHFKKDKLITRFVFQYRDKSYISLKGLLPTSKLLEAQKRKALLRQLAEEGPIELSDDD